MSKVHPDFPFDQFPEEVVSLVDFYRKKTGNNNIEALYSCKHKNWLICQLIDNEKAIHVIAQYETFEDKLRIIQ